MKINRSTLFLTELVLNIFVFAVCAAVCASLLVRASGLSRESERLTDAVYIAQSMAETFSGEKGEFYFNADGSIAGESADYSARCEKEGDTVKIEVFSADGESIYTLTAYAEVEK